MKIAVLGATGQTGKPLVQQALEQGHEVVAIVRTPSKLDIEHEKLKIVEGDIFNDECLIKNFEGCDVVMSTLGFTMMKRVVTGYSVVTEKAMNAMRIAGCKRLILMHAWYTDKSVRNEGSFFIRWILIPMIAPVLDNMRETEHLLEEKGAGIDYTVVLPPGLVNGEKTDADFDVHEGKFYIPDAATQIVRADVARYMLKVVPDEASYNKIHAIAIKK